MWDAILKVVFDIIQFLYNIFQDWGLAIIIMTIIFRLCVAPLMHKQAKSSYQMQKIQPLIQELQNKYKNDQVRLQQEMQKLYSEAKFNPLAGCLPMLLQMPIFMAMFQVLRNIQDYTTASELHFYGIIDDLTKTPATAFSEGIVPFIPYLVLIIIFAGATFLPMVLNQLNGNNKNNPQAKQTMIMAVVMSIFMVFIAWGSPAGVLLFWGVSSLIGIGQNQFTTYRCKKHDREIEEKQDQIAQSYNVEVTRKVKKSKPKKKK